MFEVVGVLVGLLFSVAILLWLIGIPVFLLLRTKRLGEQLARLERRLERLSLARASKADVEVPTLAEVERPVAAEAMPAMTLPPPQAPPDRIRELPEERPQKRLRERPPVPAPQPIDWEGWIGRRGLGWLAALLLLFAVAFFLQQAFEKGWIGPLGRVLTGIVAGVALTLAGYSYHRRGYRLFSQMVTSAGAILLYLSTYAAFGFYQLLPREHAAIFLIVVIVEIAVLALLYDALSIALMAVIGGLLTPLLLHTDQDLYRSLFLYLGVLNLGVVALLLFRSWPIVGTVALVGTQALFGAWMAERYEPEKLTACLVFQGVLLALYLLPAIASALRRQPTTIDALVRLLLNSTLSAVMLHLLLYDEYRPWLGSLALVLALVHSLLAWFLSTRHPEDTRQLFVVTAIVLSLIAMVFPWQLDVAWIGVGWAIEGMVLWWFGLRIRTAPLRLLGAILLILALGRLLFVDTPQAHQQPFVPILNSYAIPALVIAACIIVTATVSRYSPLANLPLDRIGTWTAGITGVLLTWFIFSTETYQYFSTQVTWLGSSYALVNEKGEPLYPDAQRLHQMAQMSLSLVWALYAGVILAVGFWRRNPPLRWTALGLFGLTVGKVILVDMANLPATYKVAVFFVLALVLGVAARVYQRTTTLLEAKS